MSGDEDARALAALLRDAGTIPDFALDPDGVTPHDAVGFHTRLPSASSGAVRCTMSALPEEPK